MDWYSKINRARSEDQFINGFARKFGSPEDVVVAIGDYSIQDQCEDKSRRNENLEEAFKKHNYKIYLIHEFRTSKLCYGQGQKLT